MCSYGKSNSFGAMWQSSSTSAAVTRARLADLAPHLTPYRYAFNNPIRYYDPSGLFEVARDGGGDGNNPRDLGAQPKTQEEIANALKPSLNFNTNPTQRVLSQLTTENTLRASFRSQQSATNAQSGGGSLFGDILTGTEKHFNGGLGTLGVAVQGYNKIPNNVKRHYAYKLSKMTGLKSGQIFQGAKGFANSTGKLVCKFGPVGTVLGGGVITYEVMSGTWDAHTAVNAGLMIGAGVATIFAAPGVLTGIALYGVGDYFFDFSGRIDSTIGRNSRVWKP